jgi:hypothetical protein
MEGLNMLTLEQQEEAARSHREAARRADGAVRGDYSGGSTRLSKESGPTIADQSASLVKYVHELRTVLQELSNELIGAQPEAINAVGGGIEHAIDHVSGLIPVTKQNLKEVENVLNGIRHLITALSIGTK